MAELEEIYKRKHYKLPIDWECPDCGWHCRIKGQLIGEDPNPEGKLTWEDILQKFCERCNKVFRPDRNCSSCNVVYDFDSSGCKNCDMIISDMIDMEKTHEELTTEFRKMKRRKENTETIENSIKNLLAMLKGLGAKVCDVCNEYWLITEKNFTCEKCLSKICG